MSLAQKTHNGNNTSTGKSNKKKKTLDSEYQSYTYIKNELKDKGWNISNPNRTPSGQLYTQHECLQNKEISARWGKVHPEYVIKLTEDEYWIIEAKPTIEEVNKAFDEAIWYGKLLNESKLLKSMIITGVAGNDSDKYLVRNGFWVEEKKDFQIISYEGKEITSILTPDITKRLLREKTPILKEFDIPDNQLLKAADDINKKFQEAGIRKDKRSTIIATMLLSLLGETDPNYNATPEVFVNDINGRAKESLEIKGKEDFFKYIEIQLPEKSDAKNRFKEALVDAFFTLRKINIRAAMQTGSDVLGRFYETFLKYGNGAKDLGIVLTPHHITEFAADVLNVTHNDIIYDPTCGTGGFLVSSFYRVKNNSNADQLEKFRLNGIFGIDLQSNVATLAIVNMIFRGDGRNNIINDDCLQQELMAVTSKGENSAVIVSHDDKNWRKRVEGEGKTILDNKKPVSKVLMNPPFALKKAKEEIYRFVDHALDQIDDGGLLFSVLPCSTMVKGDSYKAWRSNLLSKNTLLSVITFAEDLFYPQSQPPSLAIIVKKGTAHPLEQNVLWIRVRNDGYRKIKGKRLFDPKVLNQIDDDLKMLVQSFIMNQRIQVESKPEFVKVTKIDFEDTELELIPEAYLDENIPTIDDIQNGVEETVRDTVAFLIRASREEVAIQDE
jgi:type I restriction-modification system DNA methylase subunit